MKQNRFDFQLEPYNITWEQLKKQYIVETAPEKYEKYKEWGIKTPTGRFEIYCKIFADVGADPIPKYQELPQTPISRPDLAEIGQYNRELLTRCDQDAQREHYRKDATIAQLYAADKAALLSLPAVPLDVSRYITVKTNGYGRFYLAEGLHEYSASPQYAGCRVRVKVTASEVIPLDKNQQAIVRHARLYGEHKQQSMQWLPYLTQLSRSPHALKYSGIYAMLPAARIAVSLSPLKGTSSEGSL
jgi:hypothetical protein